MKIHKKAFIDTTFCVACGKCVSICPVNSLSIYKGIYCTVDSNKCVGCGRCANICPASTISIKEICINE